MKDFLEVIGSRLPDGRWDLMSTSATFYVRNDNIHKTYECVKCGKTYYLTEAPDFPCKCGAPL